MSIKRFRRLCTVVLATLAFGVPMSADLTAASAASNLTPATGMAACGYFLEQECTGEGYPVATGLSTVTIEFNCDALSPTGAQATTVYCYVHDLSTGTNYSAPTQTEQGAASSTAGAAINVPADRYQLCVGAGLTDLNGGVHGVSNIACFTPII